MHSLSKQFFSNIRQKIVYNTYHNILRSVLGSTNSILKPLKSHNFCFLFSGQMISTAGDMFFMVAIPWIMLANSGSPQELGFVLAVYGILRVIALPIGGMLSDKLRPRRVMLIADIVRAFLVGLLAIMTEIGHPPLWQFCAVVMPLGAFAGLFTPASFAIMPEILPQDTIQAGNALNSSSIQFATVIGASVAGVIIANFRSGVALSLDALSFVASAVTLTLMQRKESRATFLISESSKDIVREKKSSQDIVIHKVALVPTEVTFWALLRRWRLLQVGLVIVIVGNLTSGGMLEVALPTLVYNTFRASSSTYGFMLAAFGFGALGGGICAGLMSQIRCQARVALFMMLIQGVMFAVLPFVGGIAGATLSLTVAGVANGLLNILFVTLVQQQAPSHLLGRIMGTFMLAIFGFYPISVALGGLVIEDFSAAVIFPISGLAMLGAAFFGLSQTSLRNL